MQRYFVLRTKVFPHQFLRLRVDDLRIGLRFGDDFRLDVLRLGVFRRGLRVQTNGRVRKQNITYDIYYFVKCVSFYSLS